MSPLPAQRDRTRAVVSTVRHAAEERVRTIERKAESETMKPQLWKLLVLNMPECHAKLYIGRNPIHGVVLGDCGRRAIVTLGETETIAIKS